MTSFDDREKGFENKHAHDEQLRFKINARRNKLLGEWAAAQMGKTGEEAASYAQTVVMADFEAPGHDDVLHKVFRDLSDAGKAITKAEVCAHAERLLADARAQMVE